MARRFRRCFNRTFSKAINLSFAISMPNPAIKTEDKDHDNRQNQRCGMLI